MAKNWKHMVRLVSTGLKVIALATGITVSAIAAETYPEKPISIVVGFPPGGALDSMVRALAEEMSKTLGQRVTVDNRAGAGGLIATQVVTSAPADGHTLLAAALHLATGPHLNKVPYNAFTDLTMVGQTTNVPVLLLVRADSPIKDAKDIVALGKKNGNGVTIGSGGNGTTGHFGTFMVEGALSTPVIHVPFKGGAPGLMALVGGELDMMFDQPSGALQGLLQAGKIRAVVVMQKQRHPLMLDVKSAPEFGLALDTPLQGWQGLAVRTGTPAPIIQKLNAAMTAALGSPEFKKKIEKLDLESVAPNPPEVFQRYYLSELNRWGQFIRKNKISNE